MTTRLCAYPPCSKPLVRKKTESPAKFEQRMCCDQACSNKRRTNPEILRAQEQERRCEHPPCNKVLVRKNREKPSAFASRRYCDATCMKAHRANPGEAPERICAYVGCDKPLVRRQGEKWSQFVKRICCDLTCARRVACGAVPVDDLGDRDCAECGQVLVRRERESAPKWLRRRFCSPSCASRHTIRRAPTYKRPPRELAVKPCERCGGVLRQRQDESPNKFRARRFCSTACRAEPQTTAETKPCLECGKTIVRPPQISGKNWDARKFCSRQCSVAAARPTRVRPTVARKPPKPKPAPEPQPSFQELRPAAEALVPDPVVAAMDDKRKTAMRLLNDGAEPVDVAAEVGVSIALVRRWDREEVSV